MVESRQKEKGGEKTLAFSCVPVFLLCFYWQWSSSVDFYSILQILVALFKTASLCLLRCTTTRWVIPYFLRTGSQIFGILSTNLCLLIDPNLCLCFSSSRDGSCCYFLSDTSVFHFIYPLAASKHMFFLLKHLVCFLSSCLDPDWYTM